MKLDTTTRASYLLFVTEWKAAYKAFSAASRQYKQAVSEQSRLNLKFALWDHYARHGGKGPDKAEVKEAEDKRHAAQIAAGTSYEVMQKTQKLIPDLGWLDDHCRANTRIAYPRYGGFKEVANYLLALRKEGKRQAQIAWQREHSAPKELVAA